MKKNTVTCPCCNILVNIATKTPLLKIEAQTDYKPWFAPNKDWIIPLVREQQVQWACSMCLEQHRALPGDPSKQTFCDYPPYFAYYDTVQQCSDCRQEFTFSAAEQQYWYEELKFWVQSRPKQCLACRRQRRQHNAANTIYHQAVHALDDSQPHTYLQAAQAALEAGYLQQAKMHLKRAQRLTGNVSSIEELQSALMPTDQPKEQEF